MNKCLIYCTSVNIFSCSGRVQELQLQERLQEPPDSPSTSPTANPTYTPTTTTTLGNGPKINKYAIHAYTHGPVTGSGSSL